jgi:hypothetical protein
MKKRPVLDALILDMDVPKKKEGSVLVMPSMYVDGDARNLDTGTVIAMGPLAVEHFEGGVKVGDKVQIRRHAGYMDAPLPTYAGKDVTAQFKENELPAKVIRVVHHEDILCVLEEDDE